MNSPEPEARFRASAGFLAVVAQGVTSLGNLALTVLVARNTTPLEFAAFALTVPTYVVAQRFWRVLVLIPRQVQLNQQGSAGVSPPIWSTVRVATAVAIVALLLAFVAGDQFVPWTMVLAFSLPLVAAYDAVRNTALSHGRMDVVAGMDCGWVGLQAAGSGVAILIGASPLAFGVAWGLPPLVITLVTMLRWRAVAWKVSDTYTGNVPWRARVMDSITDVFSSMLVAQFIPYLIAFLAASTTAAAFRAGQIMTGPINVAIMGLLPLLQNATARLAKDGRALWRLTIAATCTFTAVAAAYAVALALIPDVVGRKLLGSTWPLAAPLLVGIGLLMIARTPFQVVATALRSMGLIRHLTVLRTINSIGLLLAATLAALFAAPPVIAISMAGVAMMTGITAHLVFRQVTQHGTPTRPPERAS